MHIYRTILVLFLDFDWSDSMNTAYHRLFELTDKYSSLILEAERYIWTHPESGFREWNTHKYLKEIFEGFGYKVSEVGDIPGFYTDIDTGREGPVFAIFAEMDALIIPNHPECDKTTGAVHACAHHLQCAALIGIAAVLSEPGALDGLCGKIRLIAVPAEEPIEIEYRKSLYDQGKIKYYCGKQEFIRRGILDDVNLAMMVHSGSAPLAVNGGCNGFVSKRMTFIGKASHGASPERGLNALYAATNALSAANAIREQYSADRHFRFHPIITHGGEAINVIPSEVVVESFTRGATMNTITAANDKINRAFAASAAAMGCKLIIEDKHGSAPRKEDKNLQAAVFEVGKLLYDEKDIKMNTDAWSAGCTDMGDVSTLMPVVHPFVGSGKLPGHSSEYFVQDRVNGCVTNAKFQLGMIYYIMCNGAEYAKKVIDEAEVLYSSKEEYIKATEALSYYGDAVEYKEDGSILIKYKQ